jgi:acyl-coenzyme A synthetase/AMP-(fatty) acid ligase
MAAHQYPRQVEISEEVPETVTGKLLRRELSGLDLATDVAATSKGERQ